MKTAKKRHPSTYKPPILTDEQRAEQILLEKCARGDQQALQILTQTYRPRLTRLAAHIMRGTRDAEDVTQEALIKAYQNIGSFRGESKFSSWLFQIVVNTSRNHLRGVSRRNETDIENEVIPSEHRDYQRIEGEQAIRKLKEAVDKLPPRQKTALELRLFEELSFKEIAVIMDCPFDTAKANYRHALMKVREQLALDGIEIPGENL